MPKNSIQCLSLNLSAHDAQTFRQIVQSLGFRRGKSTDLSGFGRAIAHQDLLVLKRENELTNIVQELIQLGRYKLVLKIGEFLSVKTYLPQSLTQIQEFIDHKQPFRIEYLDILGQPYFFDCSYAQISTYESQEYLEVRHINSLDSENDDSLQHNRCLRIDQIPDSAQISPLNIKWQELEKIKVEYSIKGNLILSYIPEFEDSQEKITLPGEETIFKIKTQISNDYWFIRKILQFGSSAEILDPDFLRTKFKNEVQKISQLYLS